MSVSEETPFPSRRFDREVADDETFADASADSGKSLHNDEDADSAGPVLARRETTLVRRSVTLFAISLFIAAGVCAAAAYSYTFQSESREFRKQFDSYATQMATFSKISAKEIFDSINTMSLTITAHAEQSGTEWPKYTIPGFDRRAASLLQQVGSRYIWFAPFVTEEDRDEWEKWSVENSEPLVYPYIHRRNWTFPISNWTAYRDPGPAEPFYAPSWQGWPIIPPTINWNGYDLKAFPECSKLMHEKKKAIYSEVTNYGIHSNGGIDTWPQNRFIAPVLDGYKEDAKVVAFLGSVIQWHQFFRNILPNHARPLQVVISNECGQNLTYTVTGTDVNFEGEGDVHEFKSENTKLEADFFDSDDSVLDFCESKITIYPTSEFRDQFHTSFPFLCAFMVIVIFVLVSCVFGCYVATVERRQTTVMDSAVKTNAIVSSLFPQQVRERLMEGQHRMASQSHLQSDLEDNPKRGDQSVFRVELGLEAASHPMNEDLLSSNPIAEMFANVTVLFADIVGFTSWSSSRGPTDVFALLEQVYSSFDRIAKRRGIFKVETIGDCYVAVSGIPNQRDDHAESAAKFCHDCRNMMPKVLKRLVCRLGPETADLGMRFGLHSGPVTAGVLRGEKSRFQLFGDTVNTAARIESTGVRNRIHMSACTASLLVAAGKESWVTRRDDLVEAKGKGTMQTYFLTINKANQRPTPPESCLQESTDTNSCTQADISASADRAL